MNTSVVIPNWNGKDSLQACIDSLLKQSLKSNIIVVENGSTDGSLEFLQNKYPDIQLVINKKNLGFAGGVNSGIRASIERSDDFVALFNNDATADKDWLKNLVDKMNSSPKIGIAAPKILTSDGKHMDSTGDMYSNWGLAYPRGRGEQTSDKYDDSTDIFAASGGASIYRIKMLEQIGLFDEDFFAYYEDVDISFRAQLAGWKIAYVPTSIVYHEIGGTSKTVSGFTTYQTIKNVPWLAIKNVPSRYLFGVMFRLRIAQLLFFFRAISRGNGLAATKGTWVGVIKTPKKLVQRHRIQKNKKVSNEYIWNMMTHDLPANSSALRSVRAKWWKLTRRSHVDSD